MQTKKNLRRPVLLAALMTVIASLFAPMSWATDAKVVLSKNHTDAFYITTDSGVPVVKVANGLHSRMYEPNEVEFQIQSDTYGRQYRLTGLSESLLEGYYTGSENTAEWFEPGWNAPGFTKNGFDALRVDFTSITGPGRCTSSVIHLRQTRTASLAPSLPVTHIRLSKGLHCRLRVISMPTGFSLAPANTP